MQNIYWYIYLIALHTIFDFTIGHHLKRTIFSNSTTICISFWNEANRGGDGRESSFVTFEWESGIFCGLKSLGSSRVGCMKGWTAGIPGNRDPARISLPPPIHSLYASHPSRCIGDPWQIVEVLTFDFVISLSSPSLPPIPCFTNRRQLTGVYELSPASTPSPPPRALSLGQRGGSGGKARSLSNADWSRFLSLALGGTWRHPHPRGCGKVGLPSFRTFDESRREHR